MNEHQIKAREIVIKMQFQPNPLAFEQARMCALIAVDEIINVLDLDYNNQYHWKEIQQEIKKI